MMKSLVSVLAILGSMSEADSVRRLLQQFPASPAQPAQPGGGAMNPVPVQTMPPIINIIPTAGPGGAGPKTKLTCKEHCTTSIDCPSTCAMTTESVSNPPNNFVMECSAAGACAASKFDFTWAAG